MTKVTTLEEPWWISHDNVLLLIYHMQEMGASAGDIVYAVEKPWKFEEEYQAARDAKDANED
jgi:hypothetical protein